MNETDEVRKQFSQYLNTLYAMAQRSGRTDLTPGKIEDKWLTLPIEEQRGILLLAQLHKFFSELKPRTREQQRMVIERDIPRKGVDSKFGLYTRKMADIFDQMQQEGDITGSWYISQSRKTPLEQDLDSSGVDWVVKRPDDTYILIQSGTRPGNARDKMRHLDRDYGLKFAAFRFIGTMPMLGGSKDLLSDTDLKNQVRSLLNTTRGFTEDVLASAFPPGFKGKFDRP